MKTGTLATSRNHSHPFSTSYRHNQVASNYQRNELFNHFSCPTPSLSTSSPVSILVIHHIVLSYRFEDNCEMELFVFCKVHSLTRLFLPIEIPISDIAIRNCAVVSRTKHANERIELLAFLIQNTILSKHVIVLFPLKRFSSFS